MQLAAAGLIFLETGSLIASDGIVFSNPPVQADAAGADCPWVRLGGSSGAGLESSDTELIWKTAVQSTILNHFSGGDPIVLNAGEVLVFKFKFKASGLNPAPRAFHVGIFNSAGGLVEGDRLGIVLNAKFKSYSGYIAALNLAGGPQASFLYRRNSDTGAVDGDNIFGLSTGGVTYLKGGEGYAVRDDEEVEGSFEIESSGTGMRITFTLDGVALSGTDPYPIESFDTIAFVNYGGNAQSITFTQCEVRLNR